MNKKSSLLNNLDSFLDRIGEKLEKKSIKYNPTIMGSSVLLTVSLFLIYIMPAQVKVKTESTVNARTFPLLVLGIIAALSVFLLMSEIYKILTHKERKEEEINALQEVRAALIFLLLLFYFLLLKPLGFIFSSILFGLGMTAYFRVKKWYYYLIVTLVICLISFVFINILHVRLP